MLSGCFSGVSEREARESEGLVSWLLVRDNAGIVRIAISLLLKELLQGLLVAAV